MSESGENTRVLIEARVIPGPLPEPYGKVIEDLSSEEVEALISIKARLDEANEALGRGEAGFIGMVVPL
jgi:pilus assembly protein TadC